MLYGIYRHKSPRNKGTHFIKYFCFSHISKAQNTIVCSYDQLHTGMSVSYTHLCQNTSPLILHTSSDPLHFAEEPCHLCLPHRLLLNTCLLYTSISNHIRTEYKKYGEFHEGYRPRSVPAADASDDTLSLIHIWQCHRAYQRDFMDLQILYPAQDSVVSFQHLIYTAYFRK